MNIHVHPRKHPTYTPQNINEHPKTPNLHTARRRGRFIVPVSLHYQKRIFTSSNTCFHIIKYVYSFHHTHISVCHFVGVYVYAGAINRPLRLLTVCQNAADRLPISWRTPTKCAMKHTLWLLTDCQLYNICAL